MAALFGWYVCTTVLFYYLLNRIIFTMKYACERKFPERSPVCVSASQDKLKQLVSFYFVVSFFLFLISIINPNFLNSNQFLILVRKYFPVSPIYILISLPVLMLLADFISIFIPPFNKIESRIYLLEK